MNKFWKAASIEIEYEREREVYTRPKPTGWVQINGIEFDLKEFMK